MLAEAVNDATHRRYFSWAGAVHPHPADDCSHPDEENIDRKGKRYLCERPMLSADQRFDEHTPGINRPQTDLHEYGRDRDSPPIRKTLLRHRSPYTSRMCCTALICLTGCRQPLIV